MRLAAYFVLLCWLSSPLLAQEIIDRVVVVVNDRVITQNDWDEQARFEALAEGRPVKAIQRSPAALERLIDRILLLQQMAELNFRPPEPGQVQQQVEAVKKQLYPGLAATNEAWSKTLREYGIPEDDFSQIVTDQANVMRFIDVRFRSNTRIAQFEIDDYYRNTFLPEYQKTSGRNNPPPIKQVQGKIQQILLEERVSEGLNAFVQSLRSQAVIRHVAPIVGTTAADAGGFAK